MNQVPYTVGSDVPVQRMREMKEIVKKIVRMPMAECPGCCSGRIGESDATGSFPEEYRRTVMSLKHARSETPY